MDGQNRTGADAQRSPEPAGRYSAEYLFDDAAQPANASAGPPGSRGIVEIVARHGVSRYRRQSERLCGETGAGKTSGIARGAAKEPAPPAPC